MLKLAKEYDVRVEASNPSLMARMKLPIWYHVHSEPSARRLYRTKAASCLRKKHRVRLVRDVVDLLSSVNDAHTQVINCRCASCRAMRATNKCSHPFKCINLAATLVEKILPNWSPLHSGPTQPPDPPERRDGRPEGEITFDKGGTATTLRDSITIFGVPPAERVDPHRNIPQPTYPQPHPATAYTDGACINNGEESAAAGLGVWYGDDDPRNISLRVPIPLQTNQTGELMAILMAVTHHPPNGDLHIMSDSRYAIDGLTKNNRKWERRNWMDTAHGTLFECITAWMRWRDGRTTLTWVKGHSGIAGNEGADKLAGEGARNPVGDPAFRLSFPPGHTAPGALLQKLEQRDFYRTINEERPIPPRALADRNVALIQACTQASFSLAPTPETVWSATRHKDFTRKVRDFLWKATQNVYKIGEFWDRVEGYEDRGICPLCNEREDMDHILTKCTSPARAAAWTLANGLWERRSGAPLPNNLGDLLGCGLAKFLRDGKPDKGKNRLYRILTSETAHLVWKLRNERRIQHGDQISPSAAEVAKRWTKAINRRLTIDRMLTDDRRFGKRALATSLVRSTWRQCLRDEESLPATWPASKGVLVGISPPRSPGAGNGLRSHPLGRGEGGHPRLPRRGDVALLRPGEESHTGAV